MTEPFSLTWTACNEPGRIACDEAPFAIVKRSARFYDVCLGHGAVAYGLNQGAQGMVFHTLKEAKAWCHAVERSNRLYPPRPSEMTPGGEQYVIPGAERRNTGTPPAQASLFDA